jgi:signal transduction histidine kinase
VLLGALLMIGAASSEAQPAVKQVLMLQSFDRGILVVDQFTGDFRVGLDQRAGSAVNVVQVVVGPTGFVGAPEDAVVDYIQSSFAGHPPPDLIITVAGPAAVFARTHRQQFFPGTPLLFASVDQHWLENMPLGENESAVAVDNDFPRLIDGILRVLPDTRQVFMVVGSGELGRFWYGKLEPEFARFRDRVSFIWSVDMSLEEILGRCASLPSHSAIVYLSFGTDAKGGAYADAQVLADLHDQANAPLFAMHSPLLGHGIVGGTMLSVEDLSRNTAEVASRILNGAPPRSLQVPPLTAKLPTFDWRELQRWGIPESRLPPGSVVKFRSPSLWDEYKLTVLAAIALLAFQSLLILRLLYERRARHRAEVESRQNLALAVDANRRETMSALATSIGHELAQPLSAVTLNAQALQRMVAARQVPPDEMGEILADIEAGAFLASQILDRHRAMLHSRQLQKKSIDLRAVIDVSLSLLAHDMRTRQIEASLEPSSTPCVIDGDPVLLQQVLLNLVRNAMDALAETPPSRRRIRIRGTVETSTVEVSVSDTGTGLPADIIDRLFMPFVTTKSNGLGIGLTIVQSIVDAHGGTIDANRNPEGGATFTVTLPRSPLSLNTA